jgi:hypothetical protein
MPTWWREYWCIFSLDEIMVSVASHGYPTETELGASGILRRPFSAFAVSSLQSHGSRPQFRAWCSQQARELMR